MSRSIPCFPLVLLAALATHVPTSAQDAPPARVMVLATYHFANPGLDVVRTEVADVLAPDRQAEIVRVVDALTRFAPSKVAVEALPESAPRLDSVYAAYRAGRHTLARNESEQLGFRLAARMDHPRVYPVDARGEFPFGAVVAYAQKNDPALAGAMQRSLGEITAETARMHRELGVVQNLRARNEPERIARDHALYLGLAGVGAGDGYAGADLLSRWYERNLRIFANLRRVARPGDRVVLIIGSGHAAILRELIRAAPGMELVETNDYLPPR